MSYKKRKLKKSRLGQLKYRLGQVKYALLKRAAVLLQKISRLFQIRFQKERVLMLNLPKALEVLSRYDRLTDNPDISKISEAISAQLNKEGLLRLCVFICPKFNTQALFSPKPENYMPATVNTLGLFEDRVAKVTALRKDLLRSGLLTELNLILGDNDAEEYIFPFMNSIDVHRNQYRERQSMYRRAFEERCRDLFGKNCVVWSLAELAVTKDKTKPNISSEALSKELKFFGWLFSVEGPYKGKLSFSRDTLIEMATQKYQLYGAQGKFLEMLGGILLQTEGPGVWLERTQMLRCTGSLAIPAIYPWIRQEEIADF